MGSSTGRSAAHSVGSPPGSPGVAPVDGATEGVGSVPLQSIVEELLVELPPWLLVAAGVLVLGLVLGYLTGVVVRRLLVRVGVPEAIEGTAFERTARSLGSSTVDIVAKLAAYFIYGVAILAALSVARVSVADRFWNEVAALLPQLFVALFVLILGVVVGDKIELVIAERLRAVKVPQIGVLPRIAKYSIIYVAILIALSQVGVATLALVVLLAGYLAALIFLGGLAFHSMLASGAAGVYLLLNQPYGIGDEVRIGDRSGVVQEVDLFVTRIEADGEEFIVPNRSVFDEGVSKRR